MASLRGILVMTIECNSPAEAANLQVGDVIQAVNDRPVTTAETLQNILDENGINHRMKLLVERQNQSIEVTVKPQPLPV